MTWQESYQQALDNNDLVTWDEPAEHDQREVDVCFMLAQDCVEMAREIYTTKPHYPVPDDLNLLVDFVVVHWADFSR